MTVTGAVRTAAATLGYSCRDVTSGAGHDACFVASVAPTAMIFVPSKAGISHSPDEFSSIEQLAAGVSVLASLLYDLAYEERQL